MDDREFSDKLLQILRGPKVYEFFRPMAALTPATSAKQILYPGEAGRSFAGVPSTSFLAEAMQCHTRAAVHANSIEIEPVDECIRSLCRLYEQGEPPQRESLRNQCRSELGLTLLHFARRAATQVLSSGNASLITEAVLALSIEDSMIDYRDTISWLALLYHAGKRSKVNVGPTFQRVSALSSQRISELITQFLSRPEDSKHIDLFGFIEAPAGEGFQFTG